MPTYDRRMIDIRTRLVHASTLTKSGHYDYVDELACQTHIPQQELFRREPTDMLTCLGCLAVCV